MVHAGVLFHIDDKSIKMRPMLASLSEHNEDAEPFTPTSLEHFLATPPCLDIDLML